MRYAVLFPGHGLPTADLVRSWRRHPAGEVLATVARASGIREDDLLAVDRHARPDVVEVAMFAVEVAGHRLLVEGSGLPPTAVAGHDAGEVTAAVVAEAMTVEDGAALLAERAHAIHDAAVHHPGGTLTVAGLDEPRQEQLLGHLPPDVTVAYDDAPGRIVLAGAARQLRAAATQATAIGAHVEDPGIEGPQHTPEMTSALVRVAAVLGRVDVTDPRIPLITGTDAHRVDSAADLARSLAEGVLAPVRWHAVQERLRDLELDAVVEIGPGVLRELAAQTVPEVPAFHVATPGEVRDLATRFVAGDLPAG